MRHGVRTTLFLLALCGPVAADEDGFGDDADGPEQNEGPELGVRLGYGVGSGDVGQDSSLEERMAGATVIGFDLGYRLHPRWFVGGYGEYAVGFTSKSAKDECDDCTFTWLHLALSVQYRVLSLPRGDVWLGLGTGHHWLNATLSERVELGQEQVLRTRSETYSGPEYVHFQLGATLRPFEGVAFGPYSSVSLGAFDKGVARCQPENLCPFSRQDVDLGNPATHLWFSSGVRVVFLP
jgi:hypothetical protein